jgi:alpha-methylacyl-CoA racemase
MSSQPALEGITVLDFSTVGPAARCSRILADYGACVIKIGPPPRPQSQPQKAPIEPPFFAYSGNRDMKRVRIDLKAADGKAAFLRLAATADVILESFRPGVVDRLGIGYQDIARINPRIVYCSTSGYGQDGPYAQWAGHDLNYLAVGGFLHCSGRRGDGGPAIPGATVADSAGGGMQAAIAILAALIRRGTTGTGNYVDVSVTEGVLSFMSLHIDQYLATGETPGPGHDILTGRYACYDVYPARDGKWLAVAAIEPAFFANLCTALGLEEWIAHQTDDARQDEIRTALRRAFGARDRDDWVAALAPRDTCVAPVYTVAELVADPQLAARRAFVSAEHPRHGRFRQLGPVLAGAPRPDAGEMAPSILRDAATTDTDDVLRAAGLGTGQIEKLRGAGVIA